MVLAIRSTLICLVIVIKYEDKDDKDVNEGFGTEMIIFVVVEESVKVNEPNRFCNCRLMNLIFRSGHTSWLSFQTTIDTN